MNFDLIAEENEAKAHVHKIPLWPKKWVEFNEEINAFNWSIEKLVNESRDKIPNEPGIYSLLIQSGIANHIACSYLMYVGKTNSLHRIFGEYLNEQKRRRGRPLINRLLNMYSNHSWFCFTIAAEADLEIIEDALLEAYLPPKNDRFPASVSQIVEALRE